MKSEKTKPEKCDWVHYRIDDKEKEYVKCSKCDRIKRIDLPDVQPCSGSKSGHKILLRKIMGVEMGEKELERIENEN